MRWEGVSVSVQLAKAILIYSGSAESAATVHAIQHERTGPIILPGVGLGKAELHKLLIVLLGGGSQALYLPENVLSISPAHLAWWCQSQVREIYFAPTELKSGVKKLSGKKVRHPSLVFHATDQGLRVFALAKAERPTLATPLFVAPYWNVYAGGKMCQGNTRFPQGLLPESIQGFEEAFFDSLFTHSLVTPLTRHPKGHAGFWSDMLSVKTVPAHWLVPRHQTLGEVLSNAQA